MLRVIQKVCLPDRRLIAQHVSRPWLEVFQGLTTLDRVSEVAHSDQQRYLTLWEEFGSQLGLRPDELRHLKGTKEVGRLAGCSWIRCPLFRATEVITQRELMRCSRCQQVRSTSDPPLRSVLIRFRQVQYCGHHCQKMYALFLRSPA